VNRLRQVVLLGVGILFVLPNTPPLLAFPCVRVGRLIVAAPDAHRRHDHQELTRAAHPDVIHIAQEVPVALNVQVVAEETVADKRRVQRLGECPDVDAFPLARQPRLDPAPKLVLRRGELGRRAEGRAVFVEVIAQLSKCRGQTDQRRDLQCLKKENEKEGESLHAESV
jgi:hypothetical protein